MKPKTDKETAQKWLIAEIESCQDLIQLQMTRILIKNFRLLYGLNLLDNESLEIRIAFKNKEEELFNQ